MNMPSVSVLAFGAYLKNHIGWWDGDRLHRSPLHGDLGDVQACQALQASATHLVRQSADASAKPAIVAHDLHPDFYSSRCALEWAQQLNVPALAVQHHHAHIAAVSCAHGLHGPVLGWALDGFGLGSDGHAWGGELLWVHGADWQRLAHLQTIALPGGDRATREPWRLALAMAHRPATSNCVSTAAPPMAIDLSGIASVPAAQRLAIERLLARQLNCPPSSSAGRWFDAVAALLGLCLYQENEAQAPQALQTAAEQALHKAWPQRERSRTDWLGAICTAPQPPTCVPIKQLVQQVLQMAQSQGVPAAALHFHWGLADGLAAVLMHWRSNLAATTGTPAVQQVCLSGGCFFNPVLRERLRWRLQQHGLAAHLLEPDGHGDSHLTWGQAWIAQDWLHRQALQPGFWSGPCTPRPSHCSTQEFL